jgi:hypothetical protein
MTQNNTYVFIDYLIYRQISMNFVNSNTAVDAINRLMKIIELCCETQSEIDNTYDLFCESVIREFNN